MGLKLRLIGCGLTLALATSGCVHYPQFEAWGPGTVFPSIEAAAVDALIYAHLQARDANDLRRMRGGTIQPVESGYTYREIHVANPYPEYVITYPLNPRDVARFHVYPTGGPERATQKDRWGVRVDPLHRPLFVLHPSLKIREYHAPVHDEVVAVADLRRPKRVILVAEN